jgi:hypothetical protein
LLVPLQLACILHFDALRERWKPQRRREHGLEGENTEGGRREEGTEEKREDDAANVEGGCGG